MPDLTPREALQAQLLEIDTARRETNGHYLLAAKEVQAQLDALDESEARAPELEHAEPEPVGFAELVPPVRPFADALEHLPATTEPPVSDLAEPRVIARPESTVSAVAPAENQPSEPATSEASEKA